MIVGIGVDTVDSTRFATHLAHRNMALIARLFTPAEQTYCLAKASAADCFAARFAAKEAFLKALGTGLRNGVSWLDMEVTNDQLGKPSLTVTGAAAAALDQYGASTIHLSLSHDGGHAVAMVVVEGT